MKDEVTCEGAPRRKGQGGGAQIVYWLKLQFHLTITTRKHLERFRWDGRDPICVPTKQLLDAKWREVERAKLETGRLGAFEVIQVGDILQPNELANLPGIYHE